MSGIIDLKALPETYNPALASNGMQAGDFVHTMLFVADPNQDGVIEESETAEIRKFLGDLDDPTRPEGADGRFDQTEAFEALKAQRAELAMELQTLKAQETEDFALEDPIDELEGRISDLDEDMFFIWNYTY